MKQPPASCLRAVAAQPSLWKEIRHPTTGALLFKYDPQTNRIHIKRGRSETIIHLDDYRPRAIGRP
jgi:hypothetical protein